MPIPLEAPPAIHQHLAELPQQNVGDLYVTIKTPYLPIYKEYLLDGWGQLCDGQDHKGGVHLMLYNKFPNHGKGYTYISWRAIPNHPDQNTYPREGKVENPQPYTGIVFD